jgi:hypothetical protein
VEGTQVKQGVSIYYASDKNIYDALNQAKVDNETLQGMFLRRNVVCSKETKRADLALFFSRLTHDLLDHKDLSNRLGIVPRRERITAVDLVGETMSMPALERAVESIKEKLEKDGDLVNVRTSGKTLTLDVSYSMIDFRKSEFSQSQNRNGMIEILIEDGRVVVRSTRSDYLDNVRDELVREIQSEATETLERREISLFHHKSHTVRSKFFLELVGSLPGYVRKDVTDVFVFKPRPNADNEDESAETGEPHIDRILLRGVGVSQSDLLRDLTKEKDYYIAKVGWVATETLGKGFGYEIEVTFTDPKDCTGFSYILRGVYELEDNGRLSKTKRSPMTSEIDAVARAIEAKARDLAAELDKPKT